MRNEWDQEWKDQHDFHDKSVINNSPGGIEKDIFRIETWGNGTVSIACKVYDDEDEEDSN